MSEPVQKKKKQIFISFDSSSRTPTKNLIIGGLGLLSTLYLLNFTVGIFEFLPDALPFLGHVDEFVAAMLFLNCLKYFGIDLLKIFDSKAK